MVEEIRNYYLRDRLSEIDPDFLEFEEEKATQEDLEIVFYALKNNLSLPNTHNSCMLYVTGLTDQFDFVEARCDTIGGSPPDLDIDWEAKKRDLIVDDIAELWGRDNVANIMAFGSLKPKSLTRRYFKITEPAPPEFFNDNTRIAYLSKKKKHYELMDEVLACVPPPKAGKEATLHEIIYGNEKKGYPANTKLVEDPKFAGWHLFANHLENMTSQFGIHAAGVIISDKPIYETIPMWKNGKSERITQFDMNECEELGSIKFDFLVINNLDIISETMRLVKERKGIDFGNIWDTPDGDKKAYSLFARGLLCGIFQFETSDVIRDASMRMFPGLVEQLSDLTALIRPGPYNAGFLDRYLNEDPDFGIPTKVQKLWSKTRGVLVYQEQLMEMFAVFCGWDLQKCDTVRRAVGKKKEKVLKALYPEFVNDFTSHGGFSQIQADYIWEVVLGCADYLFNKSHSVAYSLITYICAYLKANYTEEFFCALMTIRSDVMDAQSWAEKAPQYIMEARELGVIIEAPSVNGSDIGFTIKGDTVFFGLNAIRNVGTGAANKIIKARGNVRYASIENFIERVDTSKINTKVFDALAKAGAFDLMGYKRSDLVEKAKAFYEVKKKTAEAAERLREIELRKATDAQTIALVEERDLLRKADKASNKKRNPGPPLSVEERFRLDELEEMKLRKPRPLKPKTIPDPVEIERFRELPVSVDELIEQAHYIGCFLGDHPCRVLYPGADSIASISQGFECRVAGQVSEMRLLKTKRTGAEMAIFDINDGIDKCKVIVFPRTFDTLRAVDRIPKTGDIVCINGKTQVGQSGALEVIANSLVIYRSK